MMKGLVEKKNINFNRLFDECQTTIENAMTGFRLLLLFIL